jgi:hypothetical protein
MRTALEISILETLDLLDGAFREFAEAVAEDRYAVWLGAGISLGKLPGLEELAEAVLEHLRVRVDLSNADCRWRNSIDLILGLIGLTEGEWKAIDYTRSVTAWPDLLSIRKRLVVQYARMLDQTPMGEQGDYLVWTAVDVVRRYADLAITPGAEHLGLAALILEGAVSDIASANWDPLVERAVKLLAGTGHILLQPRILPADVQDSTAPARIYKFHGCAELAGANEAVYRARLVARASQIHGGVVDLGVSVDGGLRASGVDYEALAGVEMGSQFGVGIRCLIRDVEAGREETLGNLLDSGVEFRV